MNKNHKTPQKLLPLFLTVLLIVSTAYAVAPNVKAAEQTPQQQALTLTTEMLGFNLTKYNVQIENNEQNTETSYLGVIPQDIIE